MTAAEYHHADGTVTSHPRPDVEYAVGVTAAGDLVGHERHPSERTVVTDDGVPEGRDAPSVTRYTYREE